MNGISLIWKQISFFLAISLCPLSAEESEVWKYAVHQDLRSRPEAFWEKELEPGVTLCFTGSSISATGDISHIRPPSSILELGTRKGVRWIPLFTFRSVKAGEALLGSEARRRSFQANIADFLVRNPQYGGIHLDFEGLGVSYREDYKNLLIEIRPVFLETKKSLSLALFPQEDFDAQLSGFHSGVFKRNLADEVVLMAYDYHSPRTRPGPVTNLDWAKKNMDLLLRSYRPNQIWLGIPLYGYFWGRGNFTAKLLTFTKDKEFASTQGKDENGIRIIRTGAGEGSLIVDRSPWKEYAENLKLRGLAFWRIGF